MSPPTPLPRVNPDFLTRPRLLALLDRWSPMTVLLAPSGTGKAVLATQWAAHARAGGDDVVWLDGEVDDPADVAAVLARHAGLEPGGDLAADLRRLRRALQGLERRLAVVVNNAEPLLTAVGGELVEIVRDCREVHLVACLRHRLDPVAKALLEAETRVIGSADLDFTPDEVRQLGRLHGLDLDPEVAAGICTATGGRAALLRTGLEPLPGRDGRLTTAWSPRHVTWFVHANLVPAMPPSARSALRRAALVEQPTYGSVVAATGPLDEEARRTLEALGILDPLVRSGEPVVRLPPVMRDAFREGYDDAELGPPASLHQAVVAYWLDRDEPLHALQQAVAGRLWPVAVDVVEQHWWAMFLQDPAGLAESLAAVPVAEMRNRPRVQVAHDLVSPPDGSPARIPAEDAADDAADDVETLDLLTLLIARELHGGERARALALAVRADALAVRVRPAGAGRAAPVVQRAAVLAGRARLLTEGPTAAAGSLRSAVDGVEGPDYFAADAAGRLALVAALHGDVDAVGHWTERWRETLPELPRLRDDTEAAVRIARAGARALTLDGEGAELRDLRQELAADDELWPFAMWAETRRALAWGGRSRVRGELSLARGRPSAPDPGAWAAGLLAACEAELCLSLGRTAAASRLLAETPHDSAILALARARLARMTGRCAEALLLLEPVLAGDHTFTGARIEALVLAAWCHDELDDDGARAVAALDDAVRIARREHLPLPFALVPRPLLARHRAAVPDLDEVLAMLEEAGARPPYDAEEELPSLTPRESAVLARLGGGASLSDIARELFVSRNTVKTQCSALYRKLGVGDRTDAVRRAYQLGLLE